MNNYMLYIILYYNLIFREKKVRTVTMIWFIDFLFSFFKMIEWFELKKICNMQLIIS
jgi:hypothetical protein